jgi:hypothetical protein
MRNITLLCWIFLSSFGISTANAGEFELGGQTTAGDGKLFVCEVGMQNSCEGCNQHYFEVDGVPSSTFLLFDSTNAPKSAQVFINDLFFGSRFYVKYCVDVVGNPALGSNLIAQITPSVTISTGNYGGFGENNYHTTSGLGAAISEDCITNAVQPGNPFQGVAVLGPIFSEGISLSTPLDPPAPFELCGPQGCLRRCVYTILFNETATGYRPINCENGVCKHYESTIKTKFDAIIDFDCTNGACTGI